MASCRLVADAIGFRGLKAEAGVDEAEEEEDEEGGDDEGPESMGIKIIQCCEI
jgi:hypothetical protein